jgi:hypothetical protein
MPWAAAMPWSANRRQADNTLAGSVLIKTLLASLQSERSSAHAGNPTPIARSSAAMTNHLCISSPDCSIGVLGLNRGIEIVHSTLRLPPPSGHGLGLCAKPALAFRGIDHRGVIIRTAGDVINSLALAADVALDKALAYVLSPAAGWVWA